MGVSLNCVSLARIYSTLLNAENFELGFLVLIKWFSPGSHIVNPSTSNNAIKEKFILKMFLHKDRYNNFYNEKGIYIITIPPL